MLYSSVDSLCRVSQETGSDSPHFQQGERFTKMSERVTRREGFPSPVGATCSSYLAPSWVGASGLVMIQSGCHPKDWLSGGIPHTPSTNSTGVLSRLQRCLVCFFLVRRSSTTVVLTRHASYYYFLPPGSPFSGSVHGQAQEPRCRPQR